MNVCPVIGSQGDVRFALGASGGRKIVGAVSQLASFIIDQGMDIETAFHTPRIDVSGSDVAAADETLPIDVLTALAEVMLIQNTRRTVLPYVFGCPAVVMSGDKINAGHTEIMSPWDDVVLENDP